MCVCVRVCASELHRRCWPSRPAAETRCTNTRNENVLVETKLKLNAAPAIAAGCFKLRLTLNSVFYFFIFISNSDSLCMRFFSD